MSTTKSNKFWEIGENGRMVRKYPYKPTVEDSRTSSTDGLTLTITDTRIYTFNLEQLQHAVTADKLMGYPFGREYALDVLCGLIRKNRYDIIGNHEPYKVITNGYGQFKYVEAYHGDKLDATVIFAKLKKLLDN